MRKGDELVIHNTSDNDILININIIRQDGNTNTELGILKGITMSFVLAYISSNPYFAIKHITDISY